MNNDFFHDTTVAIISTITCSIFMLFITFCCNKIKSVCKSIKEINNQTRQQKELNDAEEEWKQTEWKHINLNIEELYKELLSFKQCWKSKIPCSERRISFLERYISILNKNLTDEQKNHILNMREDVVALYNELMISNHISKNEKRKYKDYLEKIYEIS